MTILKDKRTGAAEAALKTAALKPKVINELWSEWGANRPPDHECISILHLDKKFAEDAAGRLLKIYDSTIRYANLASSDKKEDNGTVGGEENTELDGDDGNNPPPPSQKPPVKLGKVPLMENERIVFAHELRPNQSFRIVVTGDVDSAMVDALEAFASFQKKLVNPTYAKNKPDGETH